MTVMHNAVGSYVVHALDEAAVEEFEAHLENCEECSREIREFREATAELGLLTETPPPPAQLRDAVLNAITQVRPLAPLVPGEDRIDALPFQPVPSSPVRGARHAASPAPADRATAGVVLDLESARRRRLPRALIAVAAAVALVAIGSAGWGLRLDQRLQQEQASQSVQTQQTAERKAAADREAAILRAPDAKIYAKSFGAGRISYVVSKSLNAGVVLTGDLANPPSGKTYQLWTVRVSPGGTPSYVPDVTFGGGADQRVFFVSDVSSAGAVGLTMEPSGGSSKPSMTPFAVATL